MVQRFAPNPGYSDPHWSQGFSNLTGALFGNESADAANAAHYAQARHADSATMVNRGLLDKSAREGAARSRIAASIGELSAPEVMADPARLRAVLGKVHQTAIDAGLPGDFTSHHIRSFLADSGANEDVISRAAVGAGGGPRGPDQSYTLPRQEEIRRDNERMSVAQHTATENAAMARQGAVNATSRANNTDTNATSERNIAANNAAALDRQQKHSINTGANTTTTLFDPTQISQNGGAPSIQGAPTVQSVEGRILADANDGKPLSPVAQAVVSRVTDPNPDKGRVTFNNLDEIDSEIDAQTGVALDKKTGKAIDGSELPIDPAAKTQIRALASQNFQTGRMDPATAVSSAIRQVVGGNGLVPDPSTSGWFHGATRRMIKPGAGQQAQPSIVPQEAPAPVVVPAPPPGLPPGSQFSPSRQMWRAPSGALFSANGAPAS